ncbi:MAG: RES family NAD+ phosphorylase [Candidatus Dormibacteraceae bacterium]
MRLYRVCPVDPTTAPRQPYHPSFVPRSSGQHRIDNAERYDTLYLSAQAPGAVAERFGTFLEWGDWLLEHPRGFNAQLVAFELDEARRVLDLDDAGTLLERSLRPSRVITRDRRTTQAWASDIHDEGRWAGVSWWSYYNPDWASCGLWCPPGEGSIRGLLVVSVEPLAARHPAVIEASQVLLRPWSGAGS